MKSLVAQAINLHDYSLEEFDLQLLNERTVLVKKWNWEYSLSHKFQREALKLVQASTSLRILICCSHPETLTNGRGLQKPKKGEILNLVEFKPQDHTSLPYPFFQIERGGGLTFHHPGQFIFYPIIKLNPATLSLSKMIDEIFDFSISVLDSWGVKNLSHENQLLGLWHGQQKLASMGIAIEKLTTFHGMALNIIGHKEMMKTLAGLSPCGLSSESYTSVDALATLPNSPHEKFFCDFIERIKYEWK